MLKLPNISVTSVPGAPSGPEIQVPAALVVPAGRTIRSNALAAIGPVVDALYPDGFAKLARRYDDALAGLARGHVVLSSSGSMIGYAMESPKGAEVIKLSTIWIHPGVRGRGYGRALASAIVRGWLERGVARAYVTARVGIDQELLTAFSPLGFELIDVVPDLYGEGRSEAILEWREDNAPPELWLDFYASRLVGLASPPR
jgi:N-acetylglutamate synthase-like GNAT family acetyltransferase